MATRTKGKYTSGLKSNSFGSYEDFEGHKKGEAQKVILRYFIINSGFRRALSMSDFSLSFSQSTRLLWPGLQKQSVLKDGCNLRQKMQNSQKNLSSKHLETPQKICHLSLKKDAIFLQVRFSDSYKCPTFYRTERAPLSTLMRQQLAWADLTQAHPRSSRRYFYCCELVKFTGNCLNR